MSQRIRIIKDYDSYREGQIAVVENNTAHELIDKGVAMISKDITHNDPIKTKTPYVAKFVKPRAYRRAAQSIEGLSEGIELIYEKGGLKSLEEIPAIGVNVALKIEEYLKLHKK